jgi:two-component system, sensor histidine kinase PdtaS
MADVALCCKRRISWAEVMEISRPEKTTEQSVQLKAVREISKAIAEARNLDETLDLIARRTAEIMRFDSCSIYLLDKTKQTLTLAASTGLSSVAIGKSVLRMGEGLTGWAAQQREVVAVTDAGADPRFKYLPETDETRFPSLMAMPLIAAGRVVGSANVQTTELHHFSEDEIELFSLITDLAAGALEKAQLYESMAQKVAELSALAEVSRSVTTPIYLEDILKLVVRMAAKTMGAKRCTLRLLHKPTGSLVVRASAGIADQAEDVTPLQVGEGIAGRVAQSGKPIIIEDLRHSDMEGIELFAGSGVSSILAVPLKMRDKNIGVFSCYTGEIHHFTRTEIEFFSTLANQTALAIEHTDLLLQSTIIREMHHRIKNNLQTIAMLLRLQMNAEEPIDTHAILTETISRIMSIAAVHEILSEIGADSISLVELFRRIIAGVTYQLPPGRIEIRLINKSRDWQFPSQPATNLALVLNELIQNSLKHGFKNQEHGQIEIELDSQDESLIMHVSDDGAGLPNDFEKNRHFGVGLEIVEAIICQDLRGRFELRNEGKGTLAKLTIPLLPEITKD